MTDNSKHACRTTDPGVIIGPIWLIGWLFTIGFLALPFWKAVWALVIWPYFLGAAVR